MPFYLIWKHNGETLRGRNLSTNTWIDGALTFPISFPDEYSEAQIVTVRSSAQDSGTLETLKSVKLYLTGDATDVAEVLETWPFLGDVYNPKRPELNGGFEISFDEGRTYTRFQYKAGGSSNVGADKDVSTWLTLPASAIGQSGIAGQLGPFDEAKMTVRFRIPPQISDFRKLDVRLALDFDIV